MEQVAREILKEQEKNKIMEAGGKREVSFSADHIGPFIEFTYFNHSGGLFHFSLSESRISSLTFIQPTKR